MSLKLAAQERALECHAKWQRQHAFVARNLSRSINGSRAPHELMMFTSLEHRQQLEVLDLPPGDARLLYAGQPTKAAVVADI